MGAERFFNIKCRVSGLAPDAAVVVTTVRALKAHSGAHRIVAGRPLPADLLAENPDEVRMGGANLRQAGRERPAARGHARGGDQRLPGRPRERVRRHPRDRGVARRALCGHHPLRRWRGRRHRTRPRRWPKPPTSPAASRSCTRRSGRCARRSRPSPPGCTALTGSTTSRPRPSVWTSSRPTASEGSRCASPRPTCRSPRTRP